jgi:hypothetical protein
MERLLKGYGRGAVPVLLLAGLGACGPSGTDYCEDRIECTLGSEADEDACNEYFDYHEEMADIQGCRDEFDDYFECFFDKAKCLTDVTTTSCTETQECALLGYGASCRDSVCEVRDLGFQSAEDCAALRMQYEQCSSLDSSPFGQ